jgi:hypothetical protein
MERQMKLHEYAGDFYAWSIEQAQLLREGRFDLIDAQNIAEEIESLAKHDRREVSSRLVVLQCHLLKWQYQPQRRGRSWRSTIRTQRRELDTVLADSPSLKAALRDSDWLHQVWNHSRECAEDETGLQCFPEYCPWRIDEEVLSHGWLP